MTRTRKQIFLWGWLFVFLSTSIASAQFPGKHWEMYKTTEDAGWSSSGLEAAKARYDSTAAAALLVVFDGRILVAWGDVTRRYMCHSVRKSFLSALYGIYVDEGVIDIDETLADLGIDDISPLTDDEKRAKIRDLLKARSGVYHSAAYETQRMKELRPKRGSHPRDTFWYYNNWDFNALGTIFERETGLDIFEAYDRRIAGPIGMEDYRVSDGYYHLEIENSMHPAYPFRMSARDMARFGLLFLRGGDWNGKRIISRRWIAESTTSYSEAGEGGYGYLWWVEGPVAAPGMYFALGYGGQVIGVCPAENVVFVQRVDTYREQSVAMGDALAVVKAVLDARVAPPKPRPAVKVFDPPPAQPARLTKLRKSILNRYAKAYTLRGETVRVDVGGNDLVFESPSFGTFKLQPISKNKFFMEDAEFYAVFDFNDGVPVNLDLLASEDAADFYLDILRSGADAAIRRYEKVIAAGGPGFGEGGLNGIGYRLMGNGKVDEAIALFELNVRAHPESFNVYDSLGEAYMTRGDTEAAIHNYEKSLELNPENENAKQMLRRMGVRPER
jgi:CubicO group peptidase (beta-lactamase class C family)